MTVGANRIADRRNRWLFTVLGLVLLLAGGTILITGSGLLGDDRADRPVLTDDVARWAVDHRVALWLAALVAAVVLALLALWWLWAELRPVDRSSSIGLALDDDTTVRLPLATVLDAVVADVEAVDGVERASGRLDLDDGELVAVLKVATRPGADLRVVARRVDGHVRKRVEHAVGRRARIELEVDLTPAPAAHRRVA